MIRFWRKGRWNQAEKTIPEERRRESEEERQCLGKFEAGPFRVRREKIGLAAFLVYDETSCPLIILPNSFFFGKVCFPFFFSLLNYQNAVVYF